MAHNAEVIAGQRIVFATFGSLGDLHPYIAIGRDLARRGARPVIATTDRHRQAVAEAGIEFAPMRPLEAQLGNVGEIVRRVLDPRRGFEYLARDLVMRFVRESHEDLSRAAEGAAMLVTHPLAVAGPLVAQERRLPWVSTVLSPLSLLSCDDPPLFARAAWLRKFRALGRWPYRMVFQLLMLRVRRWEAPLERLRADLGLPASAKPALLEGQYSPRLNLALFSGVLARPASDWPQNTVVCGFPCYDGAPPDPQTLARLHSFLAQGEPPIVFALGSSAVMIAGEFWEKALEAASRLKRRALLITGADLATPLPAGAQASETVAAFPYLPYSMVFPHGAAIVHPGGIGTLAQALRAGRPQLLVPVAFDQPDNARRVERLGIARTLPFESIDAAALEEALCGLLDRADYLERARGIAARLAAEDGAGGACDALLAQLALPAAAV